MGESTDKVVITPLQPANLPVVLDLLAESDLPEAGLAEHVATTLVAQVHGRIVGSAGLEVYDRAALLRSVAVEPALRGQGVGGQLVESALALAQSRQVREVYLLTETATDYFSHYGFVPVDRAAVDPQVVGSVEFTSACPVSAQAMRLVL
jgi:amino-acid N-acetyltransferase